MDEQDQKHTKAGESLSGHIHGPDCDHAHDHKPEQPYRRLAAKVGRNEPCPCNSGKKYKKCCGKAA